MELICLYLRFGLKCISSIDIPCICTSYKNYIRHCEWEWKRKKIGQVQLQGNEDPLEEEMAPVFLPGKSMDRGTSQATVHKVTETLTQMSN